MKEIIFKYYYVIFALFYSLNGYSQPSDKVKIYFRLYNKSEEISKDIISKQYKLIHESFENFYPANYSYDTQKKTHLVSGDIIYNDFSLLIVHSQDTMKLIFKTTGGQRLNFKIEKLVFKKGTYVVDNDNLNALDFNNSKSDYYNYILSSVPKNIYNREQNAIYIELNKLKLKYSISENDLNLKKENELNEINSSSDSLLLKKYKDNLSESNSGENDMIDDGKVYYSPDKRFKIFVFKGESCGANCNTFFNSFTHFNLDKREPNSLETDFFPVDTIFKLNNENYLVLQSGVDGGGIYVDEHKIATLVQFKENQIIIGKNYTFSDEDSSEKIMRIDITSNTMSDHYNSKDFYLKFDPKTNVLIYKYWRYTDENQSKRVFKSGKLIFDKESFRFVK